MRFSHRDIGDESMGRLTSLIDVVFLLLIFFMVTSSFNAPESELFSALKTKESESGRAADFEPLIINVELAPDATPVYTLGGRAFSDKDELTTLLRQLPKEEGVFIRAHGNVPWGATAGAMQACEDAGFVKVTYVPVQ